MPLARPLLAADAAFLLVMGLFGLAADIASYRAGGGPFGAMFLGDPRVIGVIEAHGLAALIGAAGLAALRSGPRRSWHAYFTAVHLLLGGANIVFFQVFVMVDGALGGVVVTAVHFLFAALQFAAFLRGRRTAAG